MYTLKSNTELNTVELNIGLLNPNGTENTVAETLGAFERYITEDYNFRVADSATELTVILKFKTEQSKQGVEKAIKNICNMLNQDCIAVVFNGHGDLISHDYVRVKVWGLFDERYFLKYEG